MTDKTTQQPTPQDAASQENAPAEVKATPVDLNAYVQALALTLKDDETSLKDLQVVVTALNVHAQLLAQIAGVQVILAETEDGQLVAAVVPLQ